MAFWSGWSDGKKWLMGIIGALIVAILAKQMVGDGGHTTKEPVGKGSSISDPNNQGNPKAPKNPSGNEGPNDSGIVENSSPPKPPVQKSPLEQRANDFNFTLKGCEPDGSDLRCRILVTNTRETRKLMISDHSRLVGTDGRSFEPNTLIKDTGKRYSKTSVHLELPTSEQLEFSLVFSGLATSMKEASLLEVKCAGFSVLWHNPPIK